MTESTKVDLSLKCECCDKTFTSKQAFVIHKKTIKYQNWEKKIEIKELYIKLAKQEATNAKILHDIKTAEEKKNSKFNG